MVLEKASDKKLQSSLSEFGARILTENDNIFEHNAWDNAEWTAEQEEEAKLKISKQYEGRLTIEEVLKHNTNPNEYWNTFYSKNADKFFKDRHWLSVEFPEVLKGVLNHPKEEKPINIMEIGCGTGATVFPLINETKIAHDANVYFYATDYSTTAVDIVKSNPLYDESKCKAFVYDITSTSSPEHVEFGTIDICSCVFVLSAIHPDTWKIAIDNLFKLLKPGGIVIFRDYGRYDMTQLRFKSGRLIDDNFYIRGDGTRVYFFTIEEIDTMFKEKFKIEQNDVDRRLIVNRAKKIKM
ncbi:hypothetical protein HK099_006353 [Clydaea vesicula]|uniref:tRNA N(3)-methylcytidine methyltransferase n=1 Tax=Clydaea vesicula TaxID=447962 RepID=A0AAD5TYB1_9FUNG|nr:hypothetical protein HK099_006353 [Clydaea vesicula]KAJ3386163.1 hypothetical protein HDU92_002670 [Lobulomyces angularis]